MEIKIPHKITLTTEKMACVGLFLFLTKNVIKTFMYYILRTPAEVNSWVAIILMYLPILLIVPSMKKRHAFLRFAGVWFCVFMICMVTHLFHPEYSDWLFHNEEFNIWLAIFRPDQALYLFLFISLVEDPKKLFRTLKWAGIILIVYNMYKLFYANIVRGHWVATGVQRGVEGEYNLGFGYDMLLLFVLFTVLGRKEGKRYYVLSGISLVCILIGGSRGPLLGVALIVLIHLWDSLRIKKIGVKLSITALLVLIFGIIIANISTIMMEVGLLLQKLGLSSRTVMLLVSGNYNADSGRSTIYGIALDLIKTGGPFGHGIYGDRYVISQQTSLWIGYCHNIALEILVDFGYILGGIILIIMAYRIIRILKAPDSEWRSLYLIFLIASSQLILSGSFWYIATFWGAIALDFKWCENYRGCRSIWPNGSVQRLRKPPRTVLWSEK